MMTEMGDEQVVTSSQNDEMKSLSNNHQNLQQMFFGLSG